jgi:outer membrane protein assembly factor BamA
VAPRFIDERTVLFTSTAMDPNNPVLPEVARNGSIPNVWTLNVETGELRQWTDTATGIVSPVPLRTGEDLSIAFVTYYKGANGIHTLTPDEPVSTVASADFGSPGPIIDFTPPFSHALLPDNIHRKGAFEKMSLAARPPVGLGVTSGGDFYGNTEVTFTDVLGDKEISFYAQSVAQYRTTALTYVNLERRFQYALQGFSQDRFYYGTNAALYAEGLGRLVDRDLAQAVQSQRGATAFGIYPFNRYARVELYGGYVHLNERFTNTALQDAAEQSQIDRFGQPLFRNGHTAPIGASFVQETTVFRDFGPVAGSTIKFSFDASPALGDNWLSRRTVDLDARYYVRLAANGVLALRFHGLQSWGRDSDFFTFGGNSEMRGYEYLEFIGHKGFFANAELRFPLIEAMLTPIGVLGGLRGALFANLGGASLNGQEFRLLSTSSETFAPIVGYQQDLLGNPIPIRGPELPVSGLRLVDGRASYGIGLQSFLLGFPMHFDWSWRTLLNREWEDLQFLYEALQEDPSGLTRGSDVFRRRQFSFWIGYDF